jgi:hypothetical protein
MPNDPHAVATSHGVKVKAAYIGQCPRRKADCAIPDAFAPTRAVPISQDGELRVNTRRHVRRLRLDLDCPHRRLESVGNRRWSFEILGEGCRTGELNVTYRRVRVTYTFSLRRYVPCRPKDSETVAENAFARVYTIEEVDEAEGERDVYTRFFVCHFASDVSHYIGQHFYPYSGYFYVEHVVLAEEKAAYVTGFTDNRYEDENRFTLVVLDTASFTFERQLRFESPSSSNRYLEIEGIVLKPNGSVAWILERQVWDFNNPYNQTYGVWKSDAGDDAELLDSGSDIDPRSLTLNGSTLTWTRAGEPRSATLD